MNSITDFKVRLKNKPSSYEKQTYLNLNNITEQNVFDGQTEELFINKYKTYRKMHTAPVIVDTSKTHVNERYWKNDKGQSVYIYRQDPSFMRSSKEMLFPQEEALGFLEDYNAWKIVGNEKYLDFNATVIEGSFNNYYTSKFTATKFKFWVEPSTGILLKDEWYDASGNVIQRKQITSLKLNTNIDDSNFKKDVIGYKLTK